MTPSEIRAELLAQHTALRRLATEVRKAASVPPDLLSSRKLRQRLEVLVAELDAHNRYEETLLGQVIRNLDSWGPVRVERMDERHARQHRELRDALQCAVDFEEPAEAVQATVAALEGLLTHMREEELELLGADVLREDTVMVDQSDG
jgi:iron-sulfur cluster repair protein YtfE (RIC family)